MNVWKASVVPGNPLTADACGAAFEGGPVALAYSRFDTATRDAARAEYLASIEPWRRGEAYDVPGEFVVTAGRADRTRRDLGGA